MPNLKRLERELDEYVDVLLGRKAPPSPINGERTDALMEYASTVLARGQEIAILLYRLEREGHITRGSTHYKFRTGELNMFNELAKRAMEMGSRRITYERMVFDQTTSDI